MKMPRHVVVVAVVLQALVNAASAAPVPWTASRVNGTPEPPPPLRSQRVYEHVRFPAGIFHLTFHPDFATNRFCYLCYTVGYRDETRPPTPRARGWCDSP